MSSLRSVISLRSSESWKLVSTVSISVSMELELKQAFQESDSDTEGNLGWKNTPLNLWTAG